MAKIAEFIKTADFKSEKHAPVIEIPSEIKAGVPFPVTVSVGKEIPHPNTTEHFISWISLFFKPTDGKFLHHLGKIEFSSHGESTEGPNQGPAYSNPYGVFHIKLEKPGTLIAESYCNIHGLWENSAEIVLS